VPASYRRPAWVEVDLGALASNIAALKDRLAPSVGFMAVVKANGYGHGMIPVAGAALEAGADRLGVALLEEALELRSVGIGTEVPIQILGETPLDGLGHAIDAGIDITTGRRETIEAIAAAASGGTARVHLKVDTGMRRIGCATGDALALARLIESHPGMVLAGVMTHFATAEEPEGQAFRDQLDAWRAVRGELQAAGVRPETWHSANSAATILSPETHEDFVRCGIAIYGLHPGVSTHELIDLKPALRLLARVSEVKKVCAGEAVSYGHTWRAQSDSTVATIPIGYGDGYTRRFSNLARACVGGAPGRIVGNVTMDQSLVLVPPGVEVAVGDVVELIGGTVSADELAGALGTINYEITCMLNGRLPRRYGPVGDDR
jgi:alanine racemase